MDVDELLAKIITSFIKIEYPENRFMCIVQSWRTITLHSYILLSSVFITHCI